MKWILAVCAAAALVVAIAFVFVVSLDIDQYRGDLIEYVETETGREFSIDGPIRLKTSLVPTLTLEGVRFGNPPWAESPYLLEVERIEAQLALLALLRAEVRIKRLLLDGVILDLERNRGGQGNWLLENRSDTPAERSGWQPDYDLASVSLTHLAVTVRGSDERVRRIDIGHLGLVERGIGQPLDVDLSAAFADTELAAAGSVSRLKRLLRDEPIEFRLDGRLGETGFSVHGRSDKPSRAFVEELELNVSAPSLGAAGAPFALDLPPTGAVILAATLVRQDEAFRFYPLHVNVGSSAIEGELVVEAHDPVPRLRGSLAAPKLVLGDFTNPAPDGPEGARLFPSTVLPFDALAFLNAELTLTIDAFETPYANFSNVHGALALDDGVLELGPIRGNLAGGTFDASLRIDASRELPVSRTHLSVTGAALGQLPPLAASGRVDGGKLDLAIELAGSGRSVQTIMAAADGRLAVDIGPASFDNGAVNLAEADLAWSFVTRLNPLAERDPRTRVECVAVRFPISGGVAENTHAIGILTDKLSVIGGGTINLGTEGVDIGARPKPRSGVGLNLSGLADFVRIGGTLTKPRAVTDGTGLVTAGAKAGAAIATAGLSVVAEGLFDRATADDRVCTLVREGQAGKTEPSVIERTTSKTKDVVRDAGEAIKGVFDNLFGN